MTYTGWGQRLKSDLVIYISKPVYITYIGLVRPTQDMFFYTNEELENLPRPYIISFVHSELTMKLIQRISDCIFSFEFY